ncbi:MAG: hypothetical protein QOI63_2033 [Thermoplasmata archaeon]|jgi:hypothetical protein|nr:hypothetical protein [Thermoplasmata archaeon]
MAAALRGNVNPMTKTPLAALAAVALASLLLVPAVSATEARSVLDTARDNCSLTPITGYVQCVLEWLSGVVGDLGTTSNGLIDAVQCAIFGC